MLPSVDVQIVQNLNNNFTRINPSMFLTRWFSFIISKTNYENTVLNKNINHKRKVPEKLGPGTLFKT